MQNGLWIFGSCSRADEIRLQPPKAARSAGSASGVMGDLLGKMVEHARMPDAVCDHRRSGQGRGDRQCAAGYKRRGQALSWASATPILRVASAPCGLESASVRSSSAHAAHPRARAAAGLCPGHKHSGKHQPKSSSLIPIGYRRVRKAL